MNYMQKTAALAAGLVLLGSASLALADTTSPMSVNIGAGGHASVTGTVSAVGSGTITVKSWGGNWVVRLSSATTVTPHTGVISDVSNIKLGDSVTVAGAAASDGSMTIDAKTVRDPAKVKALENEKHVNKDAIKAFKDSFKNIFVGTASNVSGSSFTLSTGANTSATVNTDASTKFFSNNFGSVSGIAAIHGSDHVQVFGTKTDSTITAKIVRDLSL